MCPRSQLLNYLRQAVLGDGKQHGYRLELSDHDHAVRVGGVNDVAGINQAQPDHAGDRGRDLGVSQLQLGVVNVGGILLDVALVLRD